MAIHSGADSPGRSSSGSLPPDSEAGRRVPSWDRDDPFAAGPEQPSGSDSRSDILGNAGQSTDAQLLSRIDRLLAHQERLLQHLTPSGTPSRPSLIREGPEDEDEEGADKCFVPMSPTTGRSVDDVTGDMLQLGFLDQLVWNLQLAPTGRGIRKFDPITIRVRNPTGAAGDPLLTATFGEPQESLSSDRATLIWALRETWARSLASDDWFGDRPALDHYYLKHDGPNVRKHGQSRYRPTPASRPSFLSSIMSLGKAKKDFTMTGSICVMLLRARAEYLSLGDMALAASQMLENLTLPEDLKPDDPGWERRNAVQSLLCFLLPFCRNLYSDEDNQWCSTPNGDYRSVTAIRHHFQSLSAFPPPKKSTVDGIHLGRQSGSLLSKTPTWLRERRFSVMMLTRRGPLRSSMTPKRYNIICIVSGGGGEQYVKLDFESVMHKHGLQPCGRMLAPFIGFLVVFLGVLPTWYSSWVSFLDAIDEALNVEPKDILSRDNLADLMFDKSFQHAESHFQIMQLLRIATLWIQTTHKDLKTLRDGLMIALSPTLDYSQEDQMNQNWDKTLAVLEGQSEKLLRRVDRKMEEVKSLRDGLLNATTLREASRGTQINEYLFVFTVMTIMYLPLSFVATLYGNSIDFFNFTVPSQQVAFGTAMAVVSLGTYLIAWLMMWVIRNEDRRQRWRQFRQAASQRFNPFKNAGSTMANKQTGADDPTSPRASRISTLQSVLTKRSWKTDEGYLGV